MKNLINKSKISTKELVEGYHKFMSSSIEERKEFIDERIKFCEKNCLVYFNDGNKIQTSGTSSGVRKTYLWGPNFKEFWDFFEIIRFGDFYGHTELNFKVSGYNTNYSQSQWTNPLGVKNPILSISNNHLHQAIYFLKKIENKTIITCLPSQILFFIKNNNGIDFFTCRKDILVHTTGEECSQELKNIFSSNNINHIDTMRVWDGGATFYTCKFGNLHWIDFLSKVEVKNNEIVSSDFWNLSQHFLRYKNGDVVEKYEEFKCNCGENAISISFANKCNICFNINNTIFDYKQLKKGFLIACNQTKKNLFEEIIGISLCKNNESLYIRYECINEINERKIEELLSNWLKCSVFLKRGLPYSMFKTSKIFDIKEW